MSRPNIATALPNLIAVVVRLWDAIAERILAAPLIQEVIRRSGRAGWLLPEGDNDCLTMRDSMGRDYGKPFVHFVGGNVLAWWRINEPDLHPDFLQQ